MEMRLRLFAVGVAGVGVMTMAACGAGKGRPNDSGQGPPDLTMAPLGGCQGFECFQKDCGAQPQTTLSGRVTAPNGLDPVAGALVYVPRSVPEFPPTIQCEVCNEPVGGAPIVTTTTNTDGRFVLTNVPATNAVPVIVQKGRFRRKLTVDVTECADNPLPPDQARLPKNQREGDLPKMAVGLGTWDQIECVLRSFGIDDQEFTSPSGPGAVHLYNNATELPSTDAMPTLLGNSKKMAGYNLIFLNCTDQQPDMVANKTKIETNLQDYVSAGGRLYFTDWSYDYMEQAPNFSPYIFFDGGGNQIDPQPAGAADSIWDGTPFQARSSDATLTTWLKATGASTDGTLMIQGAYALAGSVSSDTMKFPTKTWVRGNVAGRDRPHTVTYDYNQCGKVLWSSYHTQEPGAGTASPMSFPSYCASTPTTMLAQEKILEFLILEISSCIPGVG